MKKIIEQITLFDRKKLADARGYFLKTLTGTEPGLPAGTGEIYVTCGSAGQSKGGHFHKIANEWFTLLCGNARVELVEVATGEKQSLVLSEENPQTLFVPPGIAHIFHNLGEKPFLLLAYTDQLYDPADTIAYKFD